MNLRNRMGGLYFLSFLSPLLSIFYSIKTLPWNARKNVLIFIITLFGATIILPEYADGYRLNEMVVTHYVGLPFFQWLFELKEMILFSPEPGTKGDVFSHVLSYVVGTVFHAPQLYFVFVSFVYSYFFVSGISKILQTNRDIAGGISFLGWGIVLIFISYRFVDAMQTVRTWTGLWVLFNGVYGYHKTKKKRYVLLMLCAPLIHIAYFVMALPAFIAIFLRRVSPKLIILGYVASFFLVINPGGILEQMKKSELGESKVNNYYREDSSDYKKNQGTTINNFYTMYGRDWALKEGPNFLAFALIFSGLFSRRKMNDVEFGLFATGIVMATMANLGSFIPALYNRTMINSGIYITATATLLLLRGQLLGRISGWSLVLRKIMLWVCIIIFSPYILYVVSNMFQFTSIYMVALPLLGVFPVINISVREFISLLLGS